MKKTALVFVSVFMLCPNLAGALTVTKAKPVATKTTSVADTTGSLVPTVLGLVGSVQALNAQTKELTAECIPTAAELQFVNNTVKEWAKTGSLSADEAHKALKRPKCSAATGGYRQSIEVAAGVDDDLVCNDWFGGPGNDGTIWYGYPMASMATYCTDGSFGNTCSAGKQKTVSNIYNVFNLVDFSEQDYTKAEAKMASELIAKIEKCSDAKISAKKRALWGEFLIDTISSVGQPTNTGAIMQSVGSISSGGLGGGLQSISGMATSLLNK